MRRAAHRRLAAAALASVLILTAVAACGRGPSTPYLDRLKQGRLIVGSPALSPDGTSRLFVYHFTGARNGQLVVTSFRLGGYDLRSGALQPLPLPSGFNWVDPTFAPDGRHAAVLRYCYRYEGCPGGEQGGWVMLLDLRGERPDARKVADRPQADQKAPAFSPDGRWLAYAEAETRVDARGGFNARYDTFAVKRRPVAGGPAEVLFSPADHPYPQLDIQDLSFVDADELLIEARVAREHRDAFPALYGDGKDLVYLHLTIGRGAVPITESPRFAWAKDYPDLKHLCFRAGRGHFVAHARGPDGEVLRGESDLYVVADGVVRPVSARALAFGKGDLAADGTRIATSQGGDIVLVDTATGAITRTGISDRIQAAARAESGRSQAETCATWSEAPERKPPASGGSRPC